MDISNKKRRAALGDVSNEVEISKHGGKKKCIVSKKRTSNIGAGKNGSSSEALLNKEVDKTKLNMKLRPIPRPNAPVKLIRVIHPKPATIVKLCNVTKLCSPIQKLCVKNSKKRTGGVVRQTKPAKVKRSEASGSLAAEAPSTSCLIPPKQIETENNSAFGRHLSTSGRQLSTQTAHLLDAPEPKSADAVYATRDGKDSTLSKLLQIASLLPSKPPVPDKRHDTTAAATSTSAGKQDWVDIDAQQPNIYYMSDYVNDIFEHYKERELLHRVPDYMEGQSEVSSDMRMELVNWLVEVQQSFELLHESLYTAVKLLDVYASRRPISKNRLQLIGAVALNLAAKFEEKCPPMIDDYIFICDDAYKKQEFLEAEMEVLSVVGFNLSLPLSYTFLRRYATCARVRLDTLTLSRFFLETSLLHYRFVTHSDSKMAAASLFIAMSTNNDGSWDATLRHYTGYSASDLRNEVLELNEAINDTPPNICTVLSKYSHPIFHEVAKKQRPTEKHLQTLLTSNSC